MLQRINLWVIRFALSTSTNRLFCTTPRIRSFFIGHSALFQVGYLLCKVVAFPLEHASLLLQTMIILRIVLPVTRHYVVPSNICFGESVWVCFLGFGQRVSSD